MVLEACHGGLHPVLLPNQAGQRTGPFTQVRVACHLTDRSGQTICCHGARRDGVDAHTQVYDAPTPEWLVEEARNSERRHSGSQSTGRRTGPSMVNYGGDPLEQPVVRDRPYRHDRGGKVWAWGSLDGNKPPLPATVQGLHDGVEQPLGWVHIDARECHVHRRGAIIEKSHQLDGRHPWDVRLKEPESVHVDVGAPV